MKKLFLALAVTLGMIGCKSTEPVKPDLLNPTVSLSIVKPESEKPKKDFRTELEQLLEEHKVPYIAGVYIYNPESKHELFDAMREKYGYDEETLSYYEQAINIRQKLTGPLVMLPRSRIGTGEGSLLCICEGIRSYIRTKDDFESEIVDYAGYRAKLNAEGLTLCEKKIGVEEINLMTPLVYQDILDLKARTYQICELARKKMPVSDKFKEALFLKYLTIGMNLAMIITNLEGIKNEAEAQGIAFEHAQVYAFIEDAIKQARSMMEVKEVDNK